MAQVTKETMIGDLLKLMPVLPLSLWESECTALAARRHRWKPSRKQRWFTALMQMN